MKIASFLSMLLFLQTFVGSWSSVEAPASSDAEKWQLNQHRFNLEDREKQLLAQQEKLYRDVDEAKSLVKAQIKGIEAAQAALKKIKYELIDIQLQLVK